MAIAVILIVGIFLYTVMTLQPFGIGWIMWGLVLACAIATPFLCDETPGGEIKTRDQVHLRHFANPDRCAYIKEMGLSCLLLTSDASAAEVMRSSFSAARVDLELRTDAASAIELSARRHLDGFVIDRDDVSGARDVLPRIRSSRLQPAIGRIRNCERHNQHRHCV